MHHVTGGNLGPRRTPSKPCVTPYSRLEPRPVSTTPNQLPRSTLSLLSAGNHLVNGAVQPPPSWRLILQPKYAPSKTQGEFTPEDPVYFCIDGVPGLSVSQAIDGIYTGLDGRDDIMSAFKNTSALCRMQFNEHNQYTAKVNTRDHTAEWKPISRSKLARTVGKKVKQYIEREQLQDTISIDKIYLTRLVHVSKGSWQPDLFYDDSQVTLSPAA